MKKPVGPILIVLFCLVAAASVASCLQSEGQRCQVTDDCEGDLICCVRDDIASRIGGGTCTQPNKCELVTPDSGSADAQIDAGVDAQLDDATASDVTPDTSTADPDGTTDGQSDAVTDVVPDDATTDVTPDAAR